MVLPGISLKRETVAPSGEKTKVSLRRKPKGLRTCFSETWPWFLIFQRRIRNPSPSRCWSCCRRLITNSFCRQMFQRYLSF